MRKPLLIDARAEAEIEHALNYHESERKGLGHAFHAALLATLDRISDFPASFSPLMETSEGLVARSARVRRFSYRVVYVELPDGLRIVAIAHTKREPGYWRARLG